MTWVSRALLGNLHIYLLMAVLEHEEKQNRLRALRNRQDLFQEEGILNLILEAIDKINVITSQGFLAGLADHHSWEMISGYLYQLLGRHSSDVEKCRSLGANILNEQLYKHAFLMFQPQLSKATIRIAPNLPIPTV